MQFMVFHKMTDELEKGGPPDMAIIEAVGKLIEAGAKDNVFVSGEGLKPTSQRVHVAYKGGKRTITDGPFTESKELIAGYAILNLPSKEAAIEWAIRFGHVTHVNEVEVRQMPEW